MKYWLIIFILSFYSVDFFASENSKNRLISILPEKYNQIDLFIKGNHYIKFYCYLTKSVNKTQEVMREVYFQVPKFIYDEFHSNNIYRDIKPDMRVAGGTLGANSWYDSLRGKSTKAFFVPRIAFEQIIHLCHQLINNEDGYDTIKQVRIESLEGDSKILGSKYGKPLILDEAFGNSDQKGFSYMRGSSTSLVNLEVLGGELVPKESETSSVAPLVLDDNFYATVIQNAQTYITSSLTNLSAPLVGPSVQWTSEQVINYLVPKIETIASGLVLNLVNGVNRDYVLVHDRTSTPVSGVGIANARTVNQPISSLLTALNLPDVSDLIKWIGGMPVLSSIPGFNLAMHGLAYGYQKTIGKYIERYLGDLLKGTLDDYIQRIIKIVSGKILEKILGLNNGSLAEKLNIPSVFEIANNAHPEVIPLEIDEKEIMLVEEKLQKENQLVPYSSPMMNSCEQERSDSSIDVATRSFLTAAEVSNAKITLFDVVNYILARFKVQLTNKLVGLVQKTIEIILEKWLTNASELGTAAAITTAATPFTGFLSGLVVALVKDRFLGAEYERQFAQSITKTLLIKYAGHDTIAALLRESPVIKYFVSTPADESLVLQQTRMISHKEGERVYPAITKEAATGKMVMSYAPLIQQLAAPTSAEPTFYNYMAYLIQNKLSVANTDLKIILGPLYKKYVKITTNEDGTTKTLPEVAQGAANLVSQAREYIIETIHGIFAHLFINEEQNANTETPRVIIHEEDDSTEGTFDEESLDDSAFDDAKEK